MCTSISDQIGIWKCWFFKRGETQGKTSKSKGDNQQRTHSTYDVDARVWTRATFVGGDCSHHRATLAPLLSAWNNGLLCRWKSWHTILPLKNLFPARFICTLMSSLTFPRSIGLFINHLFNSNYDSRTGFANILSVLFCFFFFQLSIIALVARVETIELAPAS